MDWNQLALNSGIGTIGGGALGGLIGVIQGKDVGKRVRDGALIGGLGTAGATAGAQLGSQLGVDSSRTSLGFGGGALGALGGVAALELIDPSPRFSNEDIKTILARTHARGAVDPSLDYVHVLNEEAAKYKAEKFAPMNKQAIDLDTLSLLLNPIAGAIGGGAIGGLVHPKMGKGIGLGALVGGLGGLGSSAGAVFGKGLDNSAAGAGLGAMGGQLGGMGLGGLLAHYVNSDDRQAINEQAQQGQMLPQ